MTIQTLSKAKDLHDRIGNLHQIATAKHFQLTSSPALMDKITIDVTDDWPELRKCIEERKTKLLKEFDNL